MPDVFAREQLKPEPCTSAPSPVWGGMSLDVSLSQDCADWESLLLIHLFPFAQVRDAASPVPPASSPSSPSLQEGMFRCILPSSPWPLVPILWCRGEILSHLDSTLTFVSENKCLRNIWDLCSQRLLLSLILQELFYQSTAISCLDTSSDCAGTQNPEKQHWTEVSECSFGHCH